MKSLFSRLLCGFSLLTSLQAVLAESPARPFPQHTGYAAGTIHPASLSAADLDRETSAFYDTWKRKRIVPAKTASEMYVAFENEDDPDTISVSEGHGYGMLITAFMAGHDPKAREQFDALFRFYRGRPSVNNPRLMSWRQRKKSAKREDSASDGDFDIAYALLLADRQWGSGGPVNYLAQVKQMLDAIMQSDINRDFWSVKLGDSTLREDPEYYDTRSSDLMPDHFRAFARVPGQGDWTNVLNQSYAIIEYIQKAQAPETGFVPDFICHLNKAPVPAKPKYLESKHDGAFFYNACRVPFRVGIDGLISGEPRSRVALQKMNRWIRERTRDNPAKIAAGYTLAGKEIDPDGEMCFIAPFAVAAMVDASNQPWLDALTTYVATSSREDTGYYDSTIKMLCLIALSGNWWSP